MSSFVMKAAGLVLTAWLVASPALGASPRPDPAAEPPQIWLRCKGVNGVTHRQAIEACNTMLRLIGGKHPARALLLMSRGRQYYLSEAYDRAIADFDASIELDPRAPQPYHYRAPSY